MKRVFDLNNPVWQFIGKIADAFILHVLWVVCCIPIVTFGPSTTALYYAMMKDTRDEETHYVRAFFRSFKENMKQGIGLGLIFLVIGAALGFGMYFYTLNRYLSNMYQILWAVNIGMIILYLMTLQYVFALQARFVNTIKTTIINAFFMSIRHIGWTFVMIVIFVAVYFVVIYFNFLPLLLLGYGLVVFLDSYILNKVLQPYVDMAEGKTGEEEEKDPDAWEIPEEELNPEGALTEGDIAGELPDREGYSDEEEASGEGESSDDDSDDTDDDSDDFGEEPDDSDDEPDDSEEEPEDESEDDTLRP